MCFNVKYLTQKLTKYAERKGNSEQEIIEITKRLGELSDEINPTFYTNAFTHPRLLTFTKLSPTQPNLISWGLIPGWTKDQKQALQLQNQTLNARGETIFEKPSFKESAKKKRCLIMLDGYYEYYHLNKKVYPYLIQHKDQSPMVLGGLWDEWEDEQKKVMKTVSIVTTKANALTAPIHNNPKIKEPRMPLILNKQQQEKWLYEESEEQIKKMILPYSANDLEAFTVAPLQGKSAYGNHPNACQPYSYEELIWKDQQLF
ncbi:SOS response-associated peptidase [bacterium]|nr:SOS response-associated peptidase [bacterium]